MELKNVVIIANGGKKEAPLIAEEIKCYLNIHGISTQVYITKDCEEEIPLSIKTDLVVSVGGDGTVLYCARLVHNLGIPIFAVNLGTFGYITEIGCHEWQSVFEDIFIDRERLSRRLMLRVSVMRNGIKVYQATGLNEVVVSSAGISKVVKLDLLINNTFAGKFRSDGLIIATPTGSTGYSLAAGGPIVDSEMAALIITPICPFTLSNRPLVLGSNEMITMHVTDGQRTELMLTVDGQQTFDLQEGDDVIVEKSRSRILLVASNKRNYTEVIRAKLNWTGELHAWSVRY